MDKRIKLNRVSIILIIGLCLTLFYLIGCDKSSKTNDTTDSSADSTTTETGAVSLDNNYVVVDTGQNSFFDSSSEIATPSSGDLFYGQDGSYKSAQPSYTDNGDGTITDNNTGLMWQQDPGAKMGYDEAATNLSSFNLGGYTDWRLPTIKEQYSLIQFNGLDPSGWSGDTSGLVPFIDTDYFTFEYGDESVGERIIDSQYLSSTKYVSTTMNGDETVFGVNFADGRIKGYPLVMRSPEGDSDKKFFVMYVRGNPVYGQNSFSDNGDNTITDSATTLMWMKDDSGALNVGDDSDGALTWDEALAWAENLEYGGYSDWRLPNAKELQSIVDYSRSPATTSSAAIDPGFNTTVVTDEGGSNNYPFYWTGTTHENMANGGSAAYIAFGEALGWMTSPSGDDYTLMDVHGAGSQRSDPKSGDPSVFPYGHGPQGDVIRIFNYVRCVRDGL